MFLVPQVPRVLLSPRHHLALVRFRRYQKALVRFNWHVSSLVERKVRFSICYAGIRQFQTSEAFGIGLLDCNPHRNSRCTRLCNSFADFGLWNSSQRVLETVLCKLRASVGRSGSWTRRAGLELPGLWIRWKHQRKHRSTSPLTIRCKSHSHLSFLAVNTLRVCLRSLRIH